MVVYLLQFENPCIAGTPALTDVKTRLPVPLGVALSHRSCPNLAWLVVAPLRLHHTAAGVRPAVVEESIVDFRPLATQHPA